MKKILFTLLIALVGNLLFSQTVSNGYQVFTSATISGENNIVCKMGRAASMMWPTIEGNFSGSGINNTAYNDFVNGSVRVWVQHGNGTGALIPIGENITDPYDNVGTVVGWTGDYNGPNIWKDDGYIHIKNITEYVKKFYPGLINTWGFYRIYGECKYDKNTNNYGWVEFKMELMVGTGGQFHLNDLYVCEQENVTLNTAINTSNYFSTPTTFSVSANTCTIGDNISSNNYYVGSITNDAVDSCNITVTASNGYSITSNTSQEWWILNELYLKTPSGDKLPNYNTSPLSYQYNGWINKNVNCIDSAIIHVSNNPVVTFSAFPSPLYNNNPDLVMENYISIFNQDSYTISGPGITYNGSGNNYLMDVSLPEGTYNIETIANRGSCHLDTTRTINILKWPGTPSTPTLNWITSFDQPSDSAYYAYTPTVAEPCVDNGITIDCNYWWRHKWLCPLRDSLNGSNDTLTLEIMNPQPGYTYEWKREINGLEQSLGFGTSKAVPRRYYPQNNGVNSYKEKIYFRAQNTVSLWSSWEFVVLEYPIYQTYNTYTAADSLIPDVAQYEYYCHDGVIPNQYDASLININNVYQYSLGTGYWNTGLSLSGNKYTTSVIRDNLAPQSEGDTWYEAWNGTKYQVNSYTETARIKRNMPGPYAPFDYCDCQTRTYELHSVKKPEITSISVSQDTFNIQDPITAEISSIWSGTGNWYIDSNIMTQNPYVGDSVTYVATGSEGWHNMYVQAIDSFGCFADSMLYDFYYIKAITINDSIVDTIIYVPNGGGVGIDAHLGGNLIVTPNDDGKNDMIHLLGLAGREYEFILYDRWGKVVMTVNNINEYIYVNDLSSSTYYYKLIVENETQQGFIELKK